MKHSKLSFSLLFTLAAGSAHATPLDELRSLIHGKTVVCDNSDRKGPENIDVRLSETGDLRLIARWEVGEPTTDNVEEFKGVEVQSEGSGEYTVYLSTSWYRRDIGILEISALNLEKISSLIRHENKKASLGKFFYQCKVKYVVDSK